MEHGLAPDESVRRWQRRLEPVQKVVFGGCHLTRPIAGLLTDTGFTITELDVFYQIPNQRTEIRWSLLPGHRESPDLNCSHKMIENVGPVASPCTGVDGGWTAY